MNKQLSDFNFFAPEVIQDPFEFYQLAIKEAPVYKIPDTNIFLVTSYDVLRKALKRTDVFSNDFGALLAGKGAEDPEIKAELDKGWPQADTLLTNDPPSHTRFRSLVNMAFSQGRVNAMEDYIRDIANDLIDDFSADGEMDFMQSFAIPLPVAVIAEQLGGHRSETKMFKAWTDAFADRLGGMISRERELECAKQVVEFQNYMFEKLEYRKTNPQNDLLTDLVQARIDGEEPLNDAELLSIVQQLMVAGNETTTSSFAGGMLRLIQNPDQLSKVLADRSLIPNMVEEMLRLESPSAGLWRVVKEDTELDGVDIPKGSMLHVRFAAANRDPAKFEDPDAFDVERRSAKKQMAFGYGIHLCVGQMLSRKELTVGFEILLNRIENLALAEGKNDFKYMPNMLLRGLKELHMTYDLKK